MLFKLIKNDNFDYIIHYENEKSAIQNVTEMNSTFLILGVSFLIVYASCFITSSPNVMATLYNLRREVLVFLVF